MDEHKALLAAVSVARSSPCAKSKRGVVIFRRDSGELAACHNAPPSGFRCTGSALCRKSCGKVAVHAEQEALLSCQRFGKPIQDAEMLHVKVVDGEPVPSGGPSCPDCSKLILSAGISYMWLLQEGPEGPRLIRYTAHEFHRQTLQNCGLPGGDG